MQAALASAVAAIVREAGPDIRAVPAKNLHLTLAFLGAVPQRRFESLSEIAAQCVRDFRSRNPQGVRDSSARTPAIEVTLDTVEYWRKPQILCATASETPPSAIALADALKHALTEQGFAPDLKPFRAHVTLARKVRHVTRDLRIEPVRWHFDAIHLVESQTDAGATPDTARAGAPVASRAPAHTSIYSTREKWILDKRDV